MTLEEALYAHLIASPGVSALVEARVYPLRLPLSPQFPALTYQRISAPTIQDFSGTAKTRARIQITAWDDSYAGAKAVAGAVANALDNYSGQMGGAGGVWCDATLMTDHDLYDIELGWWYVVADYEIWY